MTAPRLGQGAASNDPIGWISRKLESLQTQIVELRAARTLNAATIGSGGLTVQGGAIWIKSADGAQNLLTLDKDGLTASANGTITIDGTLDVTGDLAVPDGSITNNALDFGQDGDAATDAITPSVYTWTSGGLSATATLSKGGLLVIVSCKMEVGSTGSSTPCQATMSYSLDGPTSVSADRSRGVHFEYDGQGMSFVGQASFAFLHTNLAGGQYVAGDAYMSDSTGSPANATTYSNRSLLLLPF